MREIEFIAGGTYNSDQVTDWSDLGDLDIGSLVLHIKYAKGSETSVTFILEESPVKQDKIGAEGDNFAVANTGALSASQNARLATDMIARYVRIKTTHVGDITTSPPTFYVRGVAR